MSDSSFYIIIKCVFIATLGANDYNVSWLVLVSTNQVTRFMISWSSEEQLYSRLYIYINA